MAFDQKPSQNEITEREFNDALNCLGAPIFERKLHPSRSLTSKGFVWVIGISAVMLSLPLFPLLGSMALWALLPHLLLVLGLLWYFIRRNDHDATLTEHIRIWPDKIAVHRKNPRHADQFWIANPYWIRCKLEDTKSAKNYLTLHGGPRVIELGAFLPPEERVELFERLNSELMSVR